MTLFRFLACLTVPAFFLTIASNGQTPTFRIDVSRTVTSLTIQAPGTLEYHRRNVFQEVPPPLGTLPCHPQPPMTGFDWDFRTRLNATTAPKIGMFSDAFGDCGGPFYGDGWQVSNAGLIYASLNTDQSTGVTHVRGTLDLTLSFAMTPFQSTTPVAGSEWGVAITLTSFPWGDPGSYAEVILNGSLVPAGGYGLRTAPPSSVHLMERYVHFLPASMVGDIDIHFDISGSSSGTGGGGECRVMYQVVCRGPLTENIFDPLVSSSPCSNEGYYGWPPPRPTRGSGSDLFILGDLVLIGIADLPVHIPYYTLGCFLVHPILALPGAYSTTHGLVGASIAVPPELAPFRLRFQTVDIQVVQGVPYPFRISPPSWLIVNW